MKNRKKLSVAFASVAVLMAATVAVVFFVYRGRFGAQDSPLAAISESAAVSIGQVRHTAVRDGRVEWKLDADTAQYSPSNQEVRLNGVRAVFYDENGREIFLTADRGTLNKSTNDMEVSGDVVVRDGRFRLSARRLVYRHESKTIATRSPVRIDAGSWEISADAMTMDLETRETRFSGKVKGSFDDMFSL